MYVDVCQGFWVISAKKDRLFCSIADLRDLDIETSTVFDVFSNDQRIKFRNYVIRLCHLVSREYAIRLPMNKLSYPHFSSWYKYWKS